MLKVFPRHNINLSQEIFKTLFEVILNGQILKGPHIELFESKFARYIGTKYAIGVGSGRLGLYLILKALKFNEGSEVILPSYTFHGVPVMLRICGLNPVFVDVRPQTCNIDISLIEKNVTLKTRAIIATHIYGQPCEIEPIMEIAKKYNLKVIEDCAEACGAEYKNRQVGSFGDASFFSLAISKNLSCFGGGMITTNNGCISETINNIVKGYAYPGKTEILINILRAALAYLGLKPGIFPWTIYPVIRLFDLFNFGFMNRMMEEKVTLFSDIPSRYQVKLANFQAAVGLKQLDRLDRVNQIKRNNAEILNRELKGIDNIKTSAVIPEAEAIHSYYRIQVKNRSSFIRQLLRKGIDTQKDNLSACSDLNIFSDFSIDCPVSKDICAKNLEIPNNQYLGKEDLSYIAKVIRKVCESNGQ